MKFIASIKKDKKILIKILLAKFLVLFFLFLVRPPQIIYDAEIYYNQTKDPSQIFKPIGTPITEETKVKPPGWTLFLYPFYTIYPNWLFWALFFNFIFSFFALYFLYKTTNEKIMWLFFFYPFFLYHSNFPLEIPIFCFLITLSFYYLKKKNFKANVICNLSSFFRIEGILISFYVLIKKFDIRNLILFFVFSFLALYIYGFSHIFLHYFITSRNPGMLYQSFRLFTPFLIPLFYTYQNFFTKHFWKVMTIWFILGASIGFLKYFYEWNLLS